MDPYIKNKLSSLGWEDDNNGLVLDNFESWSNIEVLSLFSYVFGCYEPKLSFIVNDEKNSIKEFLRKMRILELGSTVRDVQPLHHRAKLIKTMKLALEKLETKFGSSTSIENVKKYVKPNINSKPEQDIEEKKIFSKKPNIPLSTETEINYENCFSPSSNPFQSRGSLPRTPVSSKPPSRISTIDYSKNESYTNAKPNSPLIFQQTQISFFKEPAKKKNIKQNKVNNSQQNEKDKKNLKNNLKTPNKKEDPENKVKEDVSEQLQVETLENSMVLNEFNKSNNNIPVNKTSEKILEKNIKSLQVDSTEILETMKEIQIQLQKEESTYRDTVERLRTLGISDSGIQGSTVIKDMKASIEKLKNELELKKKLQNQVDGEITQKINDLKVQKSPIKKVPSPKVKKLVEDVENITEEDENIPINLRKEEDILPVRDFDFTQTKQILDNIQQYLNKWKTNQQQSVLPLTPKIHYNTPTPRRSNRYNNNYLFENYRRRTPSRFFS